MAQSNQTLSASIAPEQASPVLPKAWLIFALIVPVYMCTMFYRMAPTVLALDIGADLSLAPADLAFMSGATMLGYGLMQLPSGLLSDAWGGRRTLCLFTFVVGLSTMGFGLSTSLPGVVVARFLTGLGIAATVPCLAILARWFPAHLYSRVASLMFASGTCGTLLASSPLALGSNAVGWRAVMVGCGIFSVVLAALVWSVVRDSPHGTAMVAQKERPSLLANLKRVLSSPAFWPLCIAYSALLMVYFSFAGLWWGPYLMQACGLTKVEAGNILFVGSLTAIPAMPFLAYLSDRLKSRRAVLIPCTALAALAMLFMALTTGKLSMPAMMGVTLVFAFACGMSGVALASVKELFPVDMVGTASGCLNTIPTMAAALHQKLFGSILAWRLAVHSEDYTAAYGETLYVNVAFLVVAALAIWGIRETFGGAYSQD